MCMRVQECVLTAKHVCLCVCECVCVRESGSSDRSSAGCPSFFSGGWRKCIYTHNKRMQMSYMAMERGVATKPPKHFLPLLLRACRKRCRSTVRLTSAPLSRLLACVALRGGQRNHSLVGAVGALLMWADVCLLAIDPEDLVGFFAVLGHLRGFLRRSAACPCTLTQCTPRQGLGRGLFGWVGVGRG